jgi:hypothetical protein
MNRHFTRSEAEALLPTIRPMLERLRELRQELQALDAELRSLHWKARGNGHNQLDDSLTSVQRRRESALTAVGEQVDRIHALGIQIKDPDSGLVDFPSQRGDQVIYLCWKLGETAIEWWHDPESGFAGRQRLED